MDKERAEFFMQQALMEGRKALPDCLPNPPVGCVIVQYGKIIARGYTNQPGKEHAEAMALRFVPEDAKDLELFVSLEPCSFYGRTPSCAQEIVKRNVKKVYVSIIDPHPKNRGAGIEVLKKAKIEVHIGVLAAAATRELSPYLIIE